MTDRGHHRYVPAPRKIDRSAVAAAGLSLVDAEGPAALGVRRVATVLDVAPNALYRYVDDAEGLRRAAGDLAFARLHDDVARARSSSSEPSERVALLAETYVRHVAAHPHRWFLLGAGAKQPRGQATWQVLLGSVAAAGGLAPTSPDAVERALAVWALCHGAAGLVVDGVVHDLEQAVRSVASGSRRMAAATS